MMLFGVPVMLFGWAIGRVRGMKGRPQQIMSEIRRAATFDMQPMAEAA